MWSAPTRLVWCRYKKTSTSHWQSDSTPKVFSKPSTSASWGFSGSIVGPSSLGAAAGREAFGRLARCQCNVRDYYSRTVRCKHELNGRGNETAALRRVRHRILGHVPTRRLAGSAGG